MNTVKVLIFFCFLTLASLQAVAQQKPVFSQYMFNGLALNPAYAGNQKLLSAMALYRTQWENIPGSPRTATISAHSGFKNRRIGVGFLAMRDVIGIHKDVGFYGCYAYQVKMGRGTLSMGLQGGFNYLESNFNELILKHPDDPDLSGIGYNFLPNFGTGLFYSTADAYVGFSIPYILNNKLRDGVENTERYNQEVPYYFLTGGKVFELSRNIKIKPSGLLRLQKDMINPKQESPIGLDVNCNLILDDVVTIGASYRSGDAVFLLFELQFNENFRLGYAYDWVLSGLNPYTKGSHEIMINYRINLTPTPCHSYF